MPANHALRSASYQVQRWHALSDARHDPASELALLEAHVASNPVTYLSAMCGDYQL